MRDTSVVGQRAHVSRRNHPQGTKTAYPAAVGLNRREVLTAPAGFAAAMILPRWLSAAGPVMTGPSGEPRRLIVVTLRGGNDGLNTVVPIEDDAYYRLRPQVAIPKAATLPMDDLRGMHPSLQNLARRYRDGQVAVVSGVGAPTPNLSHFRSQDIWDTARTTLPRPDRGWLGRYADHLTSDRGAIGMIAAGQDTVPLALAAHHSPSCAIPQLEGFQFELTPKDGDRREREARERALLALLGEQGPSAPDRELIRATETARAAVLQMSAVNKQRPIGAYPETKLGRDLRLVAATIAARVPAAIFHVAQDGYDTHTSQLGPHADLLRDLDQSVSALMDDLEHAGMLEDTLILTTSEFGRRVAENGIGRSAGTDHGAASILMLLGAAARGGVHGEPIDLVDLDEDGNAHSTLDFREVYAAVLRDHLGCDPAAVLGEAFPGLEVIG